VFLFSDHDVITIYGEQDDLLLLLPQLYVNLLTTFELKTNGPEKKPGP
jgi:hypothetical protein